MPAVPGVWIAPPNRWTYAITTRVSSVPSADIAQQVTDNCEPQKQIQSCSFCGVSGIDHINHSGREGHQDHDWHICPDFKCRAAMGICLDYLRGGGIDDSQSLRNDALRVATNRIEEKNRRY